VTLARRNLSDCPNVEIVHTSFLDVRLPANSYCRGWARKALHHLTDPEKDRFFRSVGPAFQPDSLFLLEDGMFDFARERLEDEWPRVLREAEHYYGDRWAAIRADVEHTLRHEFPTGAERWAEALRCGGFVPVSVTQRTCFYGAILARKERE
ncbi:MAG TPA: class I SAM-dependent methyltransferase, partial [Candidatus Ozemobacteraceae bacterium]|nr:class I SAM-dependent methyltransferase [Candidatus Ozemobacteraceae bacterium]